MMHRHKESTIKRLSRIEGQVRGVAKMINEDRYCIDVIQQISAIKAAINKVEDAVLKDHASSCVEDAISSGDAVDQRKKFGELVELLAKVKR